MIVGIDIGSTTTKAISIDKRGLKSSVNSEAQDAVTAAYGALGKIMRVGEIEIQSIDKIVMTGAGAQSLSGNFFGIETLRINEIEAIGRGGRWLSKRENIVIANIGTGTSLIEATPSTITHLGGTGIGGGTILGLSKQLIGSSTFEHIMELAKAGDIKKIDLLIEDIYGSKISFLGKKATASNFGKVSDLAKSEDFAFGIINMVFEVIGMMAMFAAKGRGYSHVVVTGNGSNNLLGRAILEDIGKMHSITFEFPQFGEYATAVGAAISGF